MSTWKRRWRPVGLLVATATVACGGLTFSEERGSDAGGRSETAATEHESSGPPLAAASDGAASDGASAGISEAPTGVKDACPDSPCGCQTLCSGACVDTQSDSKNCGTCGKTCTAKCSRGQCVKPIAIIAGGYNTGALMSDGTVDCWGENNVGQLGNGTTVPSAVPVPVSNLSNATAIDGGCALLSDATVQCWGDDRYGQLGNGMHYMPSGSDASSFHLYFSTPVPVSNLHGVIAIGGTCAVLTNGTLECWGDNQYGQVGDGTVDNSSLGLYPVTIPTPVPNLNNVKAVDRWYRHTCALLTDGTVECWGDNSLGELGNGTVSPIGQPITTPTAVSGLSSVTAVASGVNRTCALRSSGTVACWGSGAAASGDLSSTPVQVSNVSTAVAITMGPAYSCALLSGGTVECWGYNLPLGTLPSGIDSSTTPVTVPVTVPTVNHVTAIAAGSTHMCALVSDETIRCWGQNDIGQLGNGTTTASATPVTVKW